MCDLQNGIKQAAAVHIVALYESKTKLRSVLIPLFLLPFIFIPTPLILIRSCTFREKGPVTDAAKAEAEKAKYDREIVMKKVVLTLPDPKPNAST